MLNDKTIAVVIPSYNESTQIEMVLDSMPDFVDRIVVVDDCSKDDTLNKVKAYLDKDSNKSDLQLKSIFLELPEPTPYNRADIEFIQRVQSEKELFTLQKIHNKNQESEKIILIEHTQNGGVGAAIASGYKWCKDHDIDCVAVMAGDGQMDPDELLSICSPVVNENIDYVKGNRLQHKSAWVIIPKVRFLGNSILSILTKISSGYWHLSLIHI